MSDTLFLFWNNWKNLHFTFKHKPLHDSVDGSQSQLWAKRLVLGPVFLLTLFTAVVSIQTPGEGKKKMWSVLAVQTHWIKSEYTAFSPSLFTWSNALGSVGWKVHLVAFHNKHRFWKIPPSSQTSLFETGKSCLYPSSAEQPLKGRFKLLKINGIQLIRGWRWQISCHVFTILLYSCCNLQFFSQWWGGKSVFCFKLHVYNLEVEKPHTVYKVCFIYSEPIKKVLKQASTTSLFQDWKWQFKLHAVSEGPAPPACAFTHSHFHSALWK